MLELFSRVTGSGGGTGEAGLFNGLRVRMVGPAAGLLWNANHQDNSSDTGVDSTPLLSCLSLFCVARVECRRQSRLGMGGQCPKPLLWGRTVAAVLCCAVAGRGDGCGGGDAGLVCACRQHHEQRTLQARLG